MKKNILNEELGRIKSLMEDKSNSENPIINEDFLNLYEKFNITLNDKTIKVFSNGMLNEDGIGDKFKNVVNTISTKFRNAFQNNWAKSQGLPTPKQLMENDRKKSPAVVNHPAYKDTITLMYRKKIRNENAILCWYYGEGFTGGSESPKDKKSAEKLISTFKQLENYGSYKSEGFKNFVKELEKLFAQGIYVSLDVMSDTIGDESALSELLKSQNQVAYVNVGSYDNSNFIKLTPAVKKQYNLYGDIYQGKGKNSYYISRKDGNNLSVKYKEGDGKISKQDANSAAGVNEEMFNNLAFELKNLAVEGGVAVGIEMSDDTKLSILQYVEDSANEAGQNILKATSFDIQTKDVGIDKSGIILDTQIIEEGQTLIFAFQYPDKNDKQALRTAIYNMDDGTQIPAEGISRIQGAIESGIQSVKNAGFEITAVGRYAGASTSRVGTKFGSEDGTSSEANNVTLAKERCKSMNLEVDKIIGSLLPGVEITTTDDIIQANQGPGWYTTKGADVNGPLYNQWVSGLSNLLNALDKARDNKFTNRFRTDSPFAPINFYVYRLNSTYKNCPWTKEGLKRIISTYKSYGKNSSADTKAVIDAAQKALLSYQYPTQQQVQDEYEAIYSPYRGSWVTFMLGGIKRVKTPPKELTVKDIEISAHGSWECSITFPEEIERSKDKDRDRKKIEFPDIDIKFPKLDLKKIFDGNILEGRIPDIKYVQNFCERP